MKAPCLIPRLTAVQSHGFGAIEVRCEAAEEVCEHMQENISRLSGEPATLKILRVQVVVQ